MRPGTLAFLFLLVLAVPGQTPAQTSGARSVARGTRGFYGTDFGDRYRYLGLGYGYGPGSFGPGAWSSFGGGGSNRGSRGYGGSRSGRYSRYNPDQQQENLHEQRMMWSMNFAPMPQTTPTVTINPNWNPYQSRLQDDIYHRAEPAPLPEDYKNPFVHDHH